MNTKILLAFIALSFLYFNLSANDVQEKLPNLMLEAQKIINENKDPKGKLTEVIKKIEALEVEADSDEDNLMKHKALGEFLSANGEYDKANLSIAVIAKAIPHSTFYKQMIVNMLKKGDTEKAKIIAKEFEEVVKKTTPDKDDQERQLAHIAEAFDEIKVTETK